MGYYSWILAFHILSVLSWMAMLFYLPRLFVYHSENHDKLEFLEVVKIQEFKLYRYIGVPAMWATLISGISMIMLNPALINQGWFHIKLTALVLLVAYSFSLDFYRNKLSENSSYKSGKFYRYYNEVPTILAIIIVIMVIVKP